MQIECNVCGKIHNRSNPAPYGHLTCRGCGAIGEALDYHARKWHFMTVESVGSKTAATLSGLYNCNVCGQEKCAKPGICDDCLTPPTSRTDIAPGLADVALAKKRARKSADRRNHER